MPSKTVSNCLKPCPLDCFLADAFCQLIYILVCKLLRYSVNASVASFTEKINIIKSFSDDK